MMPADVESFSLSPAAMQTRGLLHHSRAPRTLDDRYGTRYKNHEMIPINDKSIYRYNIHVFFLLFSHMHRRQE